MNKIVLYGALTAVALGGIALTSNARADGYDRRILLINHTHQAITEFHASNVGSGRWEEDILGAYVLPPGQSVVVNLNDGTGYCRFDFLTRLADGQSLVRGGVNVCELETYTVID